MFLNLAETPGQVGGFVPGVLFPLLLVWAIAFIILFAGVKRGIELANRIFIPTLCRRVSYCRYSGSYT